MSLSIIPAHNSPQVEQVRKLLEEYGNTRKGDPALVSYRREIQALPGKYGPPGGVLLLALWEDKAAGCVALRKLEEGIGEVKRLYVSPDYRRKGIALKLME
ncbi:MAG: GNAT family N-acetyltransferase, partial [Bacteroidota bacterium]